VGLWIAYRINYALNSSKQFSLATNYRLPTTGNLQSQLTYSAFASGCCWQWFSVNSLASNQCQIRIPSRINGSTQYNGLWVMAMGNGNETGLPLCLYAPVGNLINFSELAAKTNCQLASAFASHISRHKFIWPAPVSAHFEWLANMLSLCWLMRKIMCLLNS